MIGSCASADLRELSIARPLSAEIACPSTERAFAGSSGRSRRVFLKMPSRNEPCPCGSGAKYKRCCLARLDAVARELRERDALLGDVTEWLRDEHEQTLADARRETMLICMLRGRVGRNMSLVWALNDFTPADGGPPLMARFAARTDLDPSAYGLARGLAEARLGVYRVCSEMADLGFEIEPLTGGAPVQILSACGLAGLEVGEILVARVVHATSAPTLWGLAAQFGAQSERRWRARIADLPADRAQAALIVLGFHPDDAAEPLREGLDLLTAAWPVNDGDAVLDALEEAPDSSASVRRCHADGRTRGSTMPHAATPTSAAGGRTGETSRSPGWSSASMR